MNDTTLKRRDFHKLTVAAFGGLLAGTGTAAAQQTARQQPKGDGFRSRTSAAGSTPHLWRVVHVPDLTAQLEPLIPNPPQTGSQNQP